MRIHCIQHVPFETPGTILEWAVERNHTISITPAFDGGVFPTPDKYDLLLVMGGPMSVGDEREYPWLVEEKHCIERAVDGDKAVLGICLGAQLIADVLGAKVYRNSHREIGWYPVRRIPEAAGEPVFAVFPETFDAFHWHGDTFSLPSGSVRLAESEACANQAFVFEERVYGLQFHAEVTKDGVRELLRHCCNDLEKGKFVQDVHEIEAGFRFLPELDGLTRRFMNRIARLCGME